MGQGSTLARGDGNKIRYTHKQSSRKKQRPPACSGKGTLFLYVLSWSVYIITLSYIKRLRQVSSSHCREKSSEDNIAMKKKYTSTTENTCRAFSYYRYSWYFLPSSVVCYVEGAPTSRSKFSFFAYKIKHFFHSIQVHVCSFCPFQAFLRHFFSFWHDFLTGGGGKNAFRSDFPSFPVGFQDIFSQQLTTVLRTNISAIRKGIISPCESYLITTQKLPNRTAIR